jgi:hypothetical protein
MDAAHVRESQHDPSINADVYYATRVDDQSFTSLGPVLGVNGPRVGCCSGPRHPWEVLIRFYAQLREAREPTRIRSSVHPNSSRRSEILNHGASACSIARCASGVITTSPAAFGCSPSPGQTSLQGVTIVEQGGEVVEINNTLMLRVRLNPGVGHRGIRHGFDFLDFEDSQCDGKRGECTMRGCGMTRLE